MFLESELKVKVAHSCPTLCNPMDCTGPNTGVGSHSLLQGNLPNPGVEPRFPTLQAESLPSKPQAVAVIDNRRETTILEGSVEK